MGHPTAFMMPARSKAWATRPNGAKDGAPIVLVMQRDQKPGPPGEDEDQRDADTAAGSEVMLGVNAGRATLMAIPVWSERISNWPPRSRTRSRMPVSPTPAAPTEALKRRKSSSEMPLPLSATSSSM